MDIEAGLGYDFDAQQLRAFDERGWCCKEFWLPLGSPSNPPQDPPPPASGASQRSRLSADGPSLVQQGGRFHGRRSGGAQAWLKPPLVKPRRGL